MDTRQLAAFCAVIEKKSFSQAAERLGVTQPAVSLQIRALEKRLGVQLVDRSGRRVEPTEAGQRLYRNAQRVLAAEEQLLDELTEGERVTGRFELGASTGPGGSVVPILLGELARTYPELSVALTVADTHRIIELVADRAVELGVVGFARRHRSVVFEPLFRDQVVLACPPGHRFAGKTISFDDLREETLILMQEGAGVREAIEDELRAAGVRPRRLRRAARARAPGVRPRGGRGRCRRHVHLAVGDRSGSRRGHADRGARRGARAVARHLPRARRRPHAHARRAGVSRSRARTARVIVRWGLDELEDVLGGRTRVSARDRALGRAGSVVGRWSELPTDAAIDVGDAEVLLALGGGSTIDTAKRVSAETGLPLVSVPTTYSGSEWPTYFGVRDSQRRMRGGGGGAHNEAIVYDVDLTLGMPKDVTGGTALNALAHCCEALYVKGRDPAADSVALEGADEISDALPRVLADLGAREAREALLHGAAKAGEALGRSGLALAHAMAQGIGGRYGLPHGALNAICLPAGLRFNAEFVPAALLDGRAAERAEELARLAGFTTLGALGVPEEDLPELAGVIAQRPGALVNPRPASPADVLGLLRSVY